MLEVRSANGKEGEMLKKDHPKPSEWVWNTKLGFFKVRNVKQNVLVSDILKPGTTNK